MKKSISVALVIAFLSMVTTELRAIYPNLPEVPKPNPEPLLGSDFDSFNPPVASTIPGAGTPRIAEWTRVGAPDSTVALTGSRFSNLSGAATGSDTKFVVFGQDGLKSMMVPASILRLDGLKAAITLPTTLQTDGEYLIWPVNSVGVGYPVAVNATEAWWLGPNTATRGDTVSVYGRNLMRESGTPASHVYIQQSGLAGVWATVKSANPYKVDFTVPSSLVNGIYQVWIHNGYGGHYGWSGPLSLTINGGMPWNNQLFNVKNYGAKGNGVTDDEAAIEATMVAAAKVPWSTVYLPAGTYMVSRGFMPTSQSRWLGDGATKTFIKANSGFVKPAKFDPRRYAIFFNGGAKNIVFENLTIDANGNMKGYLPLPIYLRASNNLQFINVTINAKGYGTADFHGSNLIFLKNCDLIGADSGIFFGSSNQVFIDGCRVYGTNDVNTMLTFWGSNQVSCANTIAQDYDNTKSDGWAQGRFFYGAGDWGSNRDIYIGDNTTRALAVRHSFWNQNTGEQILWENHTPYSGKTIMATTTTVTIGTSLLSFSLPAGRMDAVIVNGTGLGQHRRITNVSSDGKTFTVTPAWNVAPDSSSTVSVAEVVSNCVIYHNSLQGKSDYVSRATASTGVEPYGNGYDIIVDGNSISQMRTGMSLWAMSDHNSPGSIQCFYFNYIANNSIRDCYAGIDCFTEIWNGWPTGASYPGMFFMANSFVNNSMKSEALAGVTELGNLPDGSYQFNLNIFDSNDITNTPTDYDLDPESKNEVFITDSETTNTAQTSNSSRSSSVR